MLTRALLLSALFVPAVWAADDEKPDPLPPVEARKQVGKKCTVEMTVRATKDRLAKRKRIFLDAEENFRDEKNFAVVITKAGADKYKLAGVDDPAVHFKGKKIHATGTVALDENKTPHIVVEDPKQVRILEKKE